MPEKLSYPRDNERLETEPVFTKILGKDFRLSFKFSQGSAMLQESLFILLSTQYVRQYQDNHLIAITDAEDWHELAAPPTRHQDKGVDGTHIQRESTAQSEKFQHYLRHPDLSLVAEDPELYAIILERAIAYMLSRDLKYVNEHELYVDNDRTVHTPYLIPHPDINGRPHSPSYTGRYTSYFKKYVIDSRPTGSLAFNTIFQDMKKYAQAFPHYHLEQLATAWESRHPGRSFYTPDFLQHVESTE